MAGLTVAQEVLGGEVIQATFPPYHLLMFCISTLFAPCGAGRSILTSKHASDFILSHLA